MSSDKHLQQAVQAELSWEPSINASEIGVAVEDGIITLSGHVDRYTDKLAAESAVLRVKGVKGVAEEIEVHSPLNGTRSDDEIATSAINHLNEDVYVPFDAIRVKVERGWITLDGQVDQSYQKEAAAQDVCRLLGVRGVSNNVTIKQVPSITNISDNIMHALHRSWFFDVKTINVTAQGGRIQLSGTATSARDRKLAARTAWMASGVTDVQNDILVV